MRKPSGVLEMFSVCICTIIPGGSDGKESAFNAGDLSLILGLRRCPGGGHATHSSVMPGEYHRQRSLTGYNPWGRKSQTQLND